MPKQTLIHTQMQRVSCLPYTHSHTYTHPAERTSLSRLTFTRCFSNVFVLQSHQIHRNVSAIHIISFNQLLFSSFLIYLLTPSRTLRRLYSSVPVWLSRRAVFCRFLFVIFVLTFFQMNSVLTTGVGAVQQE